MLITWTEGITWDHLKLLLKYYLSFCGLTNTLKLGVLIYIFQNSLIKILTSYRSYLNQSINLSHLITVTLIRKIYTKIITLSKELEFCPLKNYLQRKYIEF